MASMPKTTTPLRPYVRRDLRVGDRVEWHYLPQHTQEGVILEITHGGRWAVVAYGADATEEDKEQTFRSVSPIEACRIRILKPKDGHSYSTRDLKVLASYEGKDT